jgi:hypothetical protein
MVSMKVAVVWQRDTNILKEHAALIFREEQDLEEGRNKVENSIENSVLFRQTK